MLRKDREVVDRNELIDILRRCNTLRVAFLDGEYPYIVPVSFGMRTDGETIFLYFHGAKRGHKLELIERSPKVCIEGDIFYKTEKLGHGITARYESVIGTGIVEKAIDDEATDGLRAICAQYGWDDFPVGACANLSAAAVYRIRVEHLTGKRNLPEENA